MSDRRKSYWKYRQVGLHEDWQQSGMVVFDPSIVAKRYARFDERALHNLYDNLEPVTMELMYCGDGYWPKDEVFEVIVTGTVVPDIRAVRVRSGTK